ncbi:MAG: tetratricopeptide repeat protein [Polyangiaceae bacterium]
MTVRRVTRSFGGLATRAVSIGGCVCALGLAAEARAGAPGAAASKGAATAMGNAASAAQKKQDQVDRDAARALAESGFEALQQGKFDEAIALFRQAETRFHAPTHLVYLAKAQVRKGALLAAAETYRAVIAEDLPKDAPQPFLDAQAEASRALPAVLQRTPKLRVEVTGVEPAKAHVKVGSTQVSPGASTFLDPGAYVVKVSADGAVPAESRVRLEEAGGEVVVRVELAREVSLAWPVTALAVGGAAVVTSLATGIVSYDMQSSALSVCNAMPSCPPDEANKLETGKQLRDVAIVTGIAGGLALAAGVTLLLVKPSNRTQVSPPSASQVSVTRPGPLVSRPLLGAAPFPAPASQVSLQVKAGPSFIGVTGSF